MHELIDTHVHLDHPRLRGNLAEVLTYAQQVHVAKMINIGHDMESSRASVQLSAQKHNIWATIGIHPHSAKEMTAADLQELGQLAEHKKVVAVGEIGLDYHYDNSPRPVQRSVFRRQLALAQQLNLPIVIHQRQAGEDTMGILAEFAPFTQGGVMHCFSGTLEMLQQCIDLNLHIGLGGPVTFSKARQAKEAAAHVPLDRLVLETDCPYLAPHPHRGKTNQPGYLPLIAEEIARLRGIEYQQLIEACTTNALNLFGLLA